MKSPKSVALEFIEAHKSQIDVISSGVVPIAAQLKALGVDPVDESIRRIIDRYEEEMQGEFALLVSENDKFMHTADPYGQTYMMTIRPFLKAMQSKGFC
ncbi:hypothetical protein [Orrella sp. 11846]|uniref:hypothetical protein n=1 Tax=Orrella sp. 11846 TaxID=3409913 RepID=UPI003B5AA9CE